MFTTHLFGIVCLVFGILAVHVWLPAVGAVFYSVFSALYIIVLLFISAVVGRRLIYWRSSEAHELPSGIGGTLTCLWVGLLASRERRKEAGVRPVYGSNRGHYSGYGGGYGRDYDGGYGGGDGGGGGGGGDGG